MFRLLSYFICILSIMTSCQKTSPIIINGKESRLQIYQVSDNTLRVVLKPTSFRGQFLSTPSLTDYDYGSPKIDLVDVKEDAVMQQIGQLSIRVTSNPLSVEVLREDGTQVQKIDFNEDGNPTFILGDRPILGLGEGGPHLETPIDWESVPIEYDRRGRYFNMNPRWERDIYGSRNPVPFLIGTGGFGIFVNSPWVEVDLSDDHLGKFITWKLDSALNRPQSWDTQSQTATKGKPPVDSLAEGVFDMFVFDASDPKSLLKDLSEVTGKAVMPPKWTMGYMQSHRTLESDKQMVEIVDTFRKKEIPVDAVIYLGTGFTPSGWNKEQPSFEFNPEVFDRNPETVFDELHSRNVKVVLHMVPWDRDKIKYLHGSIPPEAGETMDLGHIDNYWNEHMPLMDIGVDAWWPDEGDWFDLYERMKRHQMYYEGPVESYEKRPWSLHRNGHLGIAKWGGWIWSGDPESHWKTLQAQIAVGLNHSMSLSPFWGSDIGGFFPTEELTGELYIRWFQFGAFVPAFRSHGQTWWMRLPWGWGLSEMGPLESAMHPSESSLNNLAIEPIAKKYTELRYQLLPYNYSLTWQARSEGLPMMRSMWIHYPEDTIASSLGDQYLWGSKMLIAPVYTKDAKERSVYLPNDQWYDFWTNDLVNGGQWITREVDLETMPIYVRAGSIIPFDPVRQYINEDVDGPTEIRIYSGDDGTFELYEDDGESLEYLDGNYSLTSFKWDDASKVLTLKKEVDLYNEGRRSYLIRLLPQNVMKEVEFTASEVTVSF